MDFVCHGGYPLKRRSLTGLRRPHPKERFLKKGLSFTMIGLEGLAGVAEFMYQAFWWITAFGVLSFGIAAVLLTGDGRLRPLAAIPALCASVTFTMLASFSTLCAVFITEQPRLYAYALIGWLVAFGSARLCTKATR